MLFSFAANTLVARQCRDKAEMLFELDSCTEGNLVLGVDAEQQCQFYLIRVNVGWSGVRSFGIAICSEGHGMDPSVPQHHDRETLLVGFSSEVVGVGFPEGRVVMNLPPESLFHAYLIPLSGTGIIVVHHESGVVVPTTGWETRWQYNRDVVTALSITDDAIALEFMDSPPVRLSLEMGQLLR